MGADWDNVILLTADALRADHLSCYGYHRETSPAIDELAAESIHFENAYSASSHTRESVPAMLTGEYPDVAVDENYNLAMDTIASTLSEQGFATGAFHSNPFLSRAFGYDRGFDVFDDDLHLGQHKLVALAQRALDKLRNRHYARAEEINERSLAWIDSLEDGKSFFLWNHYMDTHGPYEPPKRYLTSHGGKDVTDVNAYALYQKAVDEPDSISDTEKDILKHLYAGEIRYLDEKIGEFLSTLRDRGLLNRSLLIFTADHGDAFGERGYYEHPRYLHDELIHVPLLVRTPNQTSRNILSYASSLDIVAIIRSVRGLDDGEHDSPIYDQTNHDTPVFAQARGEERHRNIRRYALKSARGSCHCERDRDTEAVEFEECSSRDLRDELDNHVRARSRLENDDAGQPLDVADKDVERRLRALGYRE